MLGQNLEGNSNLGPGEEVNINNGDKRYLPRWEVDNRIVCKIEEKPEAYECRSKDLSCSGACLHLREKLSINKRVRLTIYLSDDISFDVEGLTAWSKVSEYGNLVGIHFHNIPPEIQDLILKYAFEFNEDDLNKHLFEGWE